MIELLNTLYVTTQGAYLRLDHDTVKVEVEGEKRLQMPLQHVGRIVVFGNVGLSPFLMHRAGEEGRLIAMLNEHGRFKCCVTGPTSGNVLLRHAQHKAAMDSQKSLEIARAFIAGKIENSRRNVLRAAREADSAESEAKLRSAALSLAESLRSLPNMTTLDEARGVEGQAAHVYFGVFDDMIRVDDESFVFDVRQRRPPRNPVNALLSFLYALVLVDCTAAVESIGLDPQVGFLHGLRPGKPAGALDLMEEFRALLADRVAFSLINRRQVTGKDFEERPGGAVRMSDDARKTLLIEYQRRKQEELTHPILDRRIPLGIAPHVQAQLLARYLRGDTEAYLPFTPK
jgi:CRISPR-associated protein Cas1